jgi:hypothetical protein
VVLVERDNDQPRESRPTPRIATETGSTKGTVQFKGSSAPRKPVRACSKSHRAVLDKASWTSEWDEAYLAFSLGINFCRTTPNASPTINQFAVR